MKVLIIANSSIVFGKELKNELTSKNSDITLLDFESLVLLDNQNRKNEIYSTRFEKFKGLAKISMFFRMLYIREIIKKSEFDIVNIHVSRWFYLLILSTLIKQKLIITFYGSDFYRTSNTIKNIQKILYEKADAITFTNPLTKQSFLDYYKQFDEKSYVCRFGLKTLDFIDKNRDKNREDLKKYLGYNQQKIIVTCGYNATIAQQHDKIIENIINLPKEIKDKVEFIFPLTYGDVTNKEKIKNRLIESDLDYLVLEDFLYEDENAYVKLASDIMINILETDSFSGSMQEFLYANNIIITGSWLPYDLFDKEGIKYHKVDTTDELKYKLKELIENINYHKKNLDNNREIIYKLSSWENNIKSWQEVYQYNKKSIK